MRVKITMYKLDDFTVNVTSSDTIKTLKEAALAYHNNRYVPTYDKITIKGQECDNSSTLAQWYVGRRLELSLRILELKIPPCYSGIVDGSHITYVSSAHVAPAITPSHLLPTPSSSDPYHLPGPGPCDRYTRRCLKPLYPQKNHTRNAERSKSCIR